MRTNHPFLFRFAAPLEEPQGTENARIASSCPKGEGSGHSRESRFTRVRNETTDDE